MVQKEELTVDKELEIIIEFLKTAKPKADELLKEFKKMQESVRKVDRLDNQIKTWDRVMQKFVFFNEDVDIAGERVKLISQSLRQRAKKEKIPVTIDKIMKKDNWVFDW